MHRARRKVSPVFPPNRGAGRGSFWRRSRVNFTARSCAVTSPSVADLLLPRNAWAPARFGGPG
eukprot:5770130-Pyramimonas_sp.AAC.1